MKVLNIYCLNQDNHDLRIYRMKGLNIYCLNQDTQDLRIYRMKRLNIYCLNQDTHRFKDLQDEEIKYLLSESGYPPI